MITKKSFNIFNKTPYTDSDEDQNDEEKKKKKKLHEERIIDPSHEPKISTDFESEGLNTEFFDKTFEIFRTYTEEDSAINSAT